MLSFAYDQGSPNMLGGLLGLIAGYVLWIGYPLVVLLIIKMVNRLTVDKL